VVGGLEHLDYFSIQLGMSSSQLTFTPSFFRGVETQPPTSKVNFNFTSHWDTTWRGFRDRYSGPSGGAAVAASRFSAGFHQPDQQYMGDINGN